MNGKSYNIYQLIHKKKLDKIVLQVGFAWTQMSPFSSNRDPYGILSPETHRNTITNKCCLLFLWLHGSQWTSYFVFHILISQAHNQLVASKPICIILSSKPYLNIFIKYTRSCRLNTFLDSYLMNWKIRLCLKFNWPTVIILDIYYRAIKWMNAFENICWEKNINNCFYTEIYKISSS